MRGECFIPVRLLMAVCLTAALVALVPASALAWCGGAHRWAAVQAIGLFREGLDDPTNIQRDPEWALFPELNQYYYGWDPWSSYDAGDAEDKTWYMANWEFIRDAAVGADDACWALWGLNHFWRVADGLHDCPYGYDADNSWETTYVLWLRALNAWQTGDLGWAYTQLGYCMHHVQDLCVPAHANDDTHAEDQLEDWLSQARAEQFYSWDGSAPLPGEAIPWPTGVMHNNSDLLNDILNAGCWDTAGCDYPVNDDVWDFPMLTDPNLPWNMQKYFYLLYWADQVGNYFASDDEDGAANAHDPTGWLLGYPGFPTELWDGYEGEYVSIHSYVGIEDNDDCDCDYDGDLTTIATWTYAAAFKATPTLIDLFRRTVDSVPPVTDVELSRSDFEEVKLPPDWNNWPVAVQLTGATDYGNPGFRISGLWKVWGECDGVPPADPNAPSWGISTDGKHKVECMSTDWCGNVEQNQDVEIWIDMTPPEVTFPDLRPNYLTSESFICTWEATDALSGVASEVAYLDDTQTVTKGQVIDLAEMAGEHWLRVIVYDNAGNWTDVFYYFEVFIDAESWALPVIVNNKTKGKGMFCVVEFPPFYDVGLIDMTTCTLAVGATLDLTADDPVVGALAVLPATLITGVGDHDGDGIPDRMFRFDKEMFVAALGGQVGDIPAVVRGGLLPTPPGLPHFLGVATVPVFTPPR